MILVALHELRRVGERLLRRGEVGGGEADHVRAGDRADAGVDRCPGHVVTEVVHVREGGRAALQHLDRGEQGPPVDEVGGDERGLGGEDVVVEPGHEGEVVGEAAQQRHRGVAVRVDQAGDDEVAGGVDHRGAVGAGRARAEQRGDAVAFDQDRAAFDDRSRVVHHHNRAAVDEEGAVRVGWPGVAGARREQEEGQGSRHRCLEFEESVTKDFVHNHVTTLTSERVAVNDNLRKTAGSAVGTRSTAGAAALPQRLNGTHSQSSVSTLIRRTTVSASPPRIT